MNKSENYNFLGKEKISKLMLKFCVPCVLSLLISALYNVVDQIFIGNSELSTLGNAATNTVFPIFIVAQAFAWCFGDGVAAYMNIHQGNNDTENMHKCIGTGITATLISSFVLLAAFYPFRTPLLYLFGASENNIAMAVEYYDIILAFFPFFMLSNMINSVVRADGCPNGSMFSMLTGAIINIILDPVFIFGCHFGMAGAAWATVIGQTASCVVSVIYLIKSKTFKLKIKSFIPNFKVFKEAFRYGSSSFITQMMILAIAVCCNNMLVKYGAMSPYGKDIPIAVIGIESKVFTIIINIVVGVVLGAQPIIGYNIGAGNIQRVKKLYRSILLCTLAVGILSTLVFELFPDFVVALFGDPTNIPNPQDYWVFGRKVFRIFLSGITLTCFIKMSSIFFQAVGNSVFAFVSSLVRDVVCFIPLVFILPVSLGIDGILFAAPISDIIGGCVAVAFTVMFFKKLNPKKL